MNEKEKLYKIGRNICAERNRIGLSQEGLAELVGISEKHLSKVENGLVNIKITTFLAIMKALNVPFEALYKE